MLSQRKFTFAISSPDEFLVDDSYIVRLVGLFLMRLYVICSIGAADYT